MQHSIDTILIANNKYSNSKIYTSHHFDSVLAKYDLQHGNIILFCGGGVAPVAYMPSDKQLKKSIM